MDKQISADIEETGLNNFQEKYRCQITVLRRDFREDLYQQHPYGWAQPCGRLEEGQVFVTESRWDPPEGFCQWAWRDLSPIIQSIHGGHPATMIACCTDGLRPVTFKLERIDG
ncbi:MAG: TIGR04076 family protein [Anaerolineales bacterium]|nr:TIGR04076 family protein [Anaerolineales bacterium]